MKKYKLKLAEEISKIVDLPVDEVLQQLTKPPRIEHGDIAFPCFQAANKLNKTPVAVAKELEQKLKIDFFSLFTAQGPYLNAFLDKKIWQELIELDIKSVDNKKILIEYPSPNTNKPLHLGHLRNILLGSTLAKLQKLVGRVAIEVNLNNDRGMGISKSLLAYMLWGSNRTPEDMGLKPDHFVGYWYVEYSKKAAENPRLEEQARELLRKWEQKDPEVISLWKKLRDWAIQGYEETLRRLGVSINNHYFESEIYEEGKQIVLEGLKKGLFEFDDKGNIIAKTSQGNKVLLRADKTAVYMTQDIALAFRKQHDYQPDIQIFVVAEEQKQHFKQLFEVLKKLDFPNADSLYHLAYGLVMLPSGRMKSREGTVVDIDDLLDELKFMAADEIKKRHQLPEEEVLRRAEIIGQAAVRFHMLKYDPLSSIVYDPKESLSFEGDTGPYILYTIARINSILKKAEVINEDSRKAITELTEWELVSLLAETEDIIIQAALKYKPHLVARHALRLAQIFTKLYHELPVLQESDDKKSTRIILLRAVLKHLKLLLDVMGIKYLDQM